MVPRLGTRSSNLWEPAVPCNGNLWFPRWQPLVPTFGNRQCLAMNQTQTFRYRSIKQNKSFCTGPLSKTIKLYRNWFHIILTCAFFVQKHFYAGPAAERKHSVTGPGSKKKICYPLSKQNKTTWRTMSSNFLQSTDPSTRNVTFSGLEPWVSSFGNPQPYNDSRLASKTYILTSGNRQFLAINGNLWFPGWEP